MSNWSINGNTNKRDVMGERIAAGTIGGEHIVSRGILARGLNAIIDDDDTRILYGTATGGMASIEHDQNNLMVNNMSETVIGGRFTMGTSGSAAKLVFKGTSIGVLGGANPYSGLMVVVVDGVETSGRLPVYLPLYVGNTPINAPTVLKTDTTIVAWGANTGFLSSGTILLGDELITYTGITIDGSGNANFTGCTRGTGGTTAVDHLGYESIYAWGSRIDLGTTTDYSTKQLLYYNPLLSPGNHTIIIYVLAGANGYARIYFDGFVTGSLVGSQNLFTQTGTVTVQTGTDANGHATIGNLFFPPSNVTLIGLLGYTQTSAEASNTVPLANLGLTRSSTYLNGETWPFFYLHNGPISSTITLVFTFTYIGETI